MTKQTEATKPKKYLLEGKFKTLDKLNEGFNTVADKTADTAVNKIPWYWIALGASLLFALFAEKMVGLGFALLFLILALKGSK